MATLRELRNKAGLTQAQAAEQMGVSNVTLGKWENGKSSPTEDTLTKLADIYKVSPSNIHWQRAGQQSEVVEQAPTLPEGSQQTVILSAGAISLLSTLDFLALSPAERQLVVQILNTFDELKALTPA